MQNKKNVSTKTKQKKTPYFYCGVVFTIFGAAYFIYNIVYTVQYIFNNVEYYTTYGYKTAEIVSSILPTVASGIFTPIGLFGAAIVCSFAADNIIRRLNEGRE